VIQVERSVLVAYSPEQMYALVDAVEAYPGFLPWCGGSVVEARDEARTRATILIDYRGIKQRFSTENAKQRPSRIDMRLVEGPFRHLDGTWEFQALGPAACKVRLRLNYEFASRILEKLVGPVFEHIASTLVDAFVERADKVYGTR
jgi:ribosome-associated toxin RatA of RatAB toxin-antitoxin module